MSLDFISCGKWLKIFLRIIECFGLEGTLKVIYFQPHCGGQVSSRTFWKVLYFKKCPFQNQMKELQKNGEHIIFIISVPRNTKPVEMILYCASYQIDGEKQP